MRFSVATSVLQPSIVSGPDWDGQEQKALVEALVARDEGAFQWLVRKHWPGMMRVATGLLGNKSLAAEVVQETWETVIREIAKFRQEASLSTWIYRILVNRARRIGKKEARSIPMSSFRSRDDEQGPVRDADEFAANGRWKSPVHGWRMIDPQNEAINREGVALLAKGLEQLPERQKIVVTLRDVEGLGSKEVCEMLHITEANQRLLLHRGRTRLRRMLEDEENRGRV